ncbi:MAG: hypothetical protein H6699_11070 [Myxococcales bacterium]|nr:hypothetical protein [Myxococcales bacterium]
MLLLVLAVGCTRSREHAHEHEAEPPPAHGYRGATEIAYPVRAPVDLEEVRRVLRDEGLDVDRVKTGRAGDLVIHVPLQQADPVALERAAAAVTALAPTTVARWSGNRLHIRADHALTEAEVRPAVASAGFEIIGVEASAEPALAEYDMTVQVAGPEVRYERVLEARFPQLVPPPRVWSVGPSRPR